MVYSSGGLTDRLITVDNGIDGTTALSYNPSTQYTNNYLPFVIQTLSSVTVNDGNGVSSTTNYTYSGGFYDYEDREFRGFQYVQATDPINTTTETWFKQDDIFKGLAYEQIIKDSADNIYTRTYNTYQSTSPYTGVNFPYLSLKVDYVYDGKATAKQAVTSYFYDSYGNITRKYLFGDISLSGDERDEYTEYQYDTLNWIVSLPSTTYVKDNAGITKAQAWFTYDAKEISLQRQSGNGGINPVIDIPMTLRQPGIYRRRKNNIRLLHTTQPIHIRQRYKTHWGIQSTRLMTINLASLLQRQTPITIQRHINTMSLVD